MKLYVEWSRPIPLRREGIGYAVDLISLPTRPGVYVFARHWGNRYEAIYIGQASGSIRRRVDQQLNNVNLVENLRTAQTGARIVLAGVVRPRQGQQLNTVLRLVERALIRHFLAEGHNLVNKQGTLIRRHELMFAGRHPRRFLRSPIYLERQGRND